MLRLEDRAQNEAVIVVPTGRLEVGTYRQLRDYLLKIGTEDPRAVIVDLTDLIIESDVSLAIFPTVHARLQEWPGVPMLLVSGSGQVRRVLTRNRTALYLPVHDSISGAMAAIDEPPPRRVVHLRLPNALTSPRIAREFARMTCVGWQLDNLSDDAVLIIGELVTNAVVHTRSAPLLRLELRRNLFSLAVYDEQPGEVCMRDPGGDVTGLHGLLLVAQIATAWGSSPTSAGGKVVWATLRAR